MNKEIMFDTLSDLVENYIASYEECFHKVLTVYIGLPFPHDMLADYPIKWKSTKIRVFSEEWKTVRQRVESCVPLSR